MSPWVREKMDTEEHTVNTHLINPALSKGLPEELDLKD